MSAFRKRPLVIEAEQWHLDDPRGNTEKFRNAVCACGERPTWHIHTLQGPHDLCDRDWIAFGVEGERYPIRDSIFRASYDAVPDHLAGAA